MKESVIYQDILEQGFQQGFQQGLQQGLQQALQREIAFVVRLVKRYFGNLDQEVETRIRSLSADQLEALGEALLDFKHPQELIAWLDRNISSDRPVQDME